MAALRFLVTSSQAVWAATTPTYQLDVSARGAGNVSTPSPRQPPSACLASSANRLVACAPAPLSRWRSNAHQRARCARGVRRVAAVASTADGGVAPSPSSSPSPGGISCTTFNILAPIYKRVEGEGVRESTFPDQWKQRNQQILELLQQLQSDIICLQEFWFRPELERLYEGVLEDKGYQLLKLPRTNGRGDGLLTAVRVRAGVRVVDYAPILFNDCGDRVAQLTRIRVEGDTQQGDAAGGHGSSDGSSSSSSSSSSVAVEFLLVNTHLLFPHNANSSLIRLREVYKVLEFLDGYCSANSLPPMPIVLCGDLNGTKNGRVFTFLRSQGFVSCYDEAKEHTDTDVCWVSHRNHHGCLVGVDYIWLLNPSQQQQQQQHPLTADWKAAVFEMIKAKLSDAGLHEGRVAFDFFRLETDRSKGGEAPDHVTFQQFKYAVDQLGLTGEGSVGLTIPEIEELVRSADTDGNGVIDYAEFQSLLLSPSMEATYDKIKLATGIVESPVTSEPSDPAATPPTHAPAAAADDDADAAPRSALPDLVVHEARLFPEPMGEGVWPDDYCMSDHAALTAVLRPLEA